MQSINLAPENPDRPYWGQPWVWPSTLTRLRVGHPVTQDETTTSGSLDARLEFSRPSQARVKAQMLCRAHQELHQTSQRKLHSNNYGVSIKSGPRQPRVTWSAAPCQGQFSRSTTLVLTRLSPDALEDLRLLRRHAN